MKMLDVVLFFASPPLELLEFLNYIRMIVIIFWYSTNFSDDGVEILYIMIQFLLHKGEDPALILLLHFLI